MEIKLSSGMTVQMRGPDELTARDRHAMLSGTPMPSQFINNSGVQVQEPLNLGMVTGAVYAVLASVITSWTFPYLLPKDDTAVDENGTRTWEQSLNLLPIDDWNELEEAIEPHMAKLRGTGPKAPAKRTSTSSGTSRARAGSSRKA